MHEIEEKIINKAEDNTMICDAENFCTPLIISLSSFSLKIILSYHLQLACRECHSLYICSIKSVYIVKITFFLSFSVGPNSPVGMEKS